MGSEQQETRSIRKRKYVPLSMEDEDDSVTVKMMKLDEDVDIDIRKAVHLPALRTPIRNCIPSYFVPKKLSDQRGKKKSNSNQNQNNNKDGTNYDLICDCCYNHDPSRFFQDTQNCPVCKDCGVVKVSEVTYCNELQESETKNKQCYKRRSYLGERLRQFSDSEPRIPEPDLQTIRYTYARLREAFNQDHPLFKKSTHKRAKYIERLVRSFTIYEDEFWEKDKQTKTQWAAEARRYKLPICTKTLRLSCPAKECIEKKNDMTPVYIECKSRQGGTYVAMMYCCNYCNAFAVSKEEAQRNNIFAGHIVSKFVQNYIRRARDCGIDDISTIPLPENAHHTMMGVLGGVLNQASANLPNLDIIEELRDKLKEIHAIIVKEFKKEKEFVCGTCEDQIEEEEKVVVD